MLRRALTGALCLAAAACAGGGPTDPSATAAAVTEGPLPPDVRAIVHARCVQCHDTLRLFGAPMALLRTEDFHRPAPSDGSRPTHALVLERVRDTARPMPPWPYAPLPPDELRVLQAWVQRGAPAGLDDGVSGQAGSGPVTPIPPASSEGCDLAVELRAHHEPLSGDQTPFALTGPTERLECFVFRSPWDQPAHALRFEPLVDDAAIVHHISLGALESPSEFTFDGKVTPCGGIQDPVRYALAFWLPGVEPVALPADVGMRLPYGPSAHYVLQVHYSVSGGEHHDRSGFRVCATGELRTHEAQLHWLGNEKIDIAPGARASLPSTCPVRGSEPVHVVSVQPHMHLRGRRMRFEHIGLQGGATLLQDEVFRFEEQAIYPVTWTLAPGEALRTTCEIENTTPERLVFGQLTSQEMCYAFVFAYPGGALSDVPLTEGQHGCVTR